MVDPDRVQAALQTKRAGGPCSACGQANWGLEETSFFLPAATDSSVNMGQGLSPIAMICRNCGFVRMHMPTVLGV